MAKPMRDFVAVKQSTFVARYGSVWQRFDELCEEMGVSLTPIHQSQKNRPSTGKSKKPKKMDNYPLVQLYREICGHYALAKQRHYSPMLVQALHERVMAGHELIYGAKPSNRGGLLDFVFFTFPNRVRQYQTLFWVSFGIFYLPLIIMGVACYLNDELIYSVMGNSQVAMMESMYDPANNHIGRDADRASDTDLMMFGHYIRNNISIDLGMYGLGIFAGIGTILWGFYNGVVIGAVAGHLTGMGFSETFWQFVVGHGSFELMGVVIAIMAGLRLGLGVVAPAPYTRKDALKVAGIESVQLLMGAVIMTFLAAFIEAFWSSSSVIPPVVKYVVAFGLWTLVAIYLIKAGRTHESR